MVGTSGGGSGDGIQQNTDTDIGSDVLDLDKTFQCFNVSMFQFYVRSRVINVFVLLLFLVFVYLSSS